MKNDQINKIISGFSCDVAILIMGYMWLCSQRIS